VGVTGHRAVRLTPALIARIPPVIDAVLVGLRDGVERMRAADAGTAPSELWMHTALATGADQLVAASAHRLGYRVRAVLPFPIASYREDFAAGGERNEFERALEEADAVLTLPSGRNSGDAGYVLAGRTIVAHADLLVAVWDGDSADYAEGGTAHVVALADEAGLPVVHIQVDRTHARVGPVVLRSGKGATPLQSEAAFDSLLRGIDAPHVRSRGC
jgi:hypothetical protein